MAKIHVLDKHTAELIAAGEVVERPASVMKELLENAIDAGATVITAEIRSGGVTFLSVIDNGCGMEAEDVPKAFLRHATSKVRTETDLNAIGTLGFRGEALASVAAVAKVELITCTGNAVVGTHYRIEGGEEIEHDEVGCPCGTTIIIRDLFYNVPARMKFLKKDVGEANAVQSVVEKLALSHPEISVRFIREGKEVLLTPGNGDLLACIYAVFGRDFSQKLIPLEHTLNGVKVSGFISRPTDSRANRTMQHFYINGRYVKTRTAAAALEQAFKGSVMAGRFPACVMFIELPFELVDANVHPAKIEVRFANEKPVFDAVYYGVKTALEQGDVRKAAKAPVADRAVSEPIFTMPSVKPAASVAIPQKPTPPVANRISFNDIVAPSSVKQSSFTQQPVVSKPLPSVDITVEEKVEEKTPVVKEEPPVVTEKQEQVVWEPSVQTVMETATEKPEIRFVGEIFKTYILAEMDGALYCIDKHAAHERILYNQLKTMENNAAQMLLTPLSVVLTAEEYDVLLSASEELYAAGFEVEEFGDSTLLVRAIPSILTGADIAATLQEIANGLLEGRRDLLIEKRDWIYHSTACRAAIKAGDTSSAEELKKLAERVLWNEDVRYCPHGRPVCVEWTKKELEKQFGRL